MSNFLGVLNSIKLNEIMSFDVWLVGVLEIEKQVNCCQIGMGVFRFTKTNSNLWFSSSNWMSVFEFSKWTDACDFTFNWKSTTKFIEIKKFVSFNWIVWVKIIWFFLWGEMIVCYIVICEHAKEILSLWHVFLFLNWVLYCGQDKVSRLLSSFCLESCLRFFLLEAY